jgi:hypothetical protein
MGRIRLHVALDCSAFSLETFVLEHIEPGSTVVTDAWKGYQFINKKHFRHETNNLSKSANRESLWGVHLVATLLKRLIRGTYQGRFETKYLQNYLDEYVFRFNRRKSRNIGKKFMRIVQEVVRSSKITWTKIQWDMDPLSEHFMTT